MRRSFRLTQDVEGSNAENSMPPSSHSSVSQQSVASVSEPPGRFELRPVLPVLLLAALVYAPALDNGFSLDDFNWLARAAATADGEFSTFLLEPEPGQVFNPVPKLLLLLGFDWFGATPLPFHGLVLALHLLNVVLVFALGTRSCDRRAGLIASALFAIWPASSESVFWVAAFFHPLVTTFYLATMLAFLEAQRAGGRARGIFGASLALALLTKALAFAIAPALLTYWLLRPKKRDDRGLGPSLIAWAITATMLVALLNLALGISDSYLFDRGLYAPGMHWLTNLWHYISWLGFPFHNGAHRIGLGAMLPVLKAIGGLVVVTLALYGVRRGEWRPKWWVAQVLLCLAPVLPFTLSPTSRYLYLATVPFALLVASLAIHWVDGAPVQASGSKLTRRKGLVSAAIGVFALLSWAEVRLTDNHYEYREQQMATWVNGIVKHFPSEAPDGLTIIGLPTLAIDSGIHLEAALRLHWRAPQFSLQTLERERAKSNSDSSPTRPILWFDRGAFTDRAQH